MFETENERVEKLPERYNIREAYDRNLLGGGEGTWHFRGRMSPYRWAMLSGAGIGAAWGLHRLLNRRKWKGNL